MQNILTDKEWAVMHLRNGEDWIEGYWRTRDHPHRTFLVEHIAKFSPIYNVSEIGFCYGPSLYHIAKRFREANSS